MKMLTLLFAGCLLFGCEEQPATKVTDPPPSPSPVTTKEPAPEPAQTKKDPAGNPKRIYQLKDLEAKTFKHGPHTIKVWLMDDPGKREEGMMWLEDKEVKDNEGMLFVFGDEADRAFWMQNTVLPLDIAYISSKGKVVNIVQGKSFDESSLPSKGPAMYVLELKKGRCAKFGIRPGMVLKLPPHLTSKG